jgi:hypothetical protein
MFSFATHNGEVEGVGIGNGSKGDLFGDIGIVGCIILKWIFNKI